MLLLLINVNAKNSVRKFTPHLNTHLNMYINFVENNSIKKL